MESQRTFGLSPWVRRLLVANLVAFLCQKTILVDPRFQQVLEFDPLSALSRPWTFITYMFLHSGLLHLAFNLLALFMFGPPVEERMGGRRFILYYFLCGLGGAALSFALMQLKPVGPIVGASAAVYGVLLAFAWYWPDQPIYIFPFPAPIRAKWLVTFAVGISFLLALLTLSDGVAYLAHLGGFGAGFLYLKSSAWWLARAERRLRRTPEASVVVQSARVAGGGSNEPPKRPRPPARDAAQAEIDRVLDKISARGIDSLTPAERRFLSEMSRKMRDRP
ncbi:MAG TPA: rhomboid family intramembrane serine protease [Gemmatimonadales bacterium]|nr:rhomboid family intramembrane serine protease [Gemmatimonadales bacterium]